MKKQTIHVHDEAARQQVLNFIKGLTIEREGAKPLAWVIDVAQYHRKRTLSQNALEHMWYDEIADFSGDTQAGVKEDMIAEFAPLIESKVTAGKMRHKRPSEMNKSEHSEYLDRVYGWATGFGIYLKLPEEQGR